MHIRTLCLGILAFGDATGYEIKKMSEEGRFSHFVDASYGSIYPALTRLTQEGLVRCREEQQSGKPDRKVYSITPSGLEAFVAGLNEEPADDKFKSEFLFLILCAEFLDRARVAHAVDAYLERLREKIGILEEAAVKCDHPGSQYCIGYGLAVYRAAFDYVRANRQSALALTASNSTIMEGVK